MAYYLGCVHVDEGITNTATALFPLPAEYSWQQEQAANVAVHQFGDGDLKIEQRFYVGPGKTSWTIPFRNLSASRKRKLLTFWEQLGGPQNAFLFDAPQDDGRVVRKTCIFDPEQSLQWTQINDLIASASVTLIEIPDSNAAPLYSVARTLTRFPDSTLETALLGQVQQIVPLLTITPLAWGNHENTISVASPGAGTTSVSWSSRTASSCGLFLGNPLNPTVAAIEIGSGGSSGSASGPGAWGTQYTLMDLATGRVLATATSGGQNPICVSDRLCAVGGTYYWPRLITHSGISQQLGSPDSVTFTLGNADRVWTRMRNVVNLRRADVQFGLYHVQTQTLVQFWRGEVKGWKTDESSNFQIECSDPAYEQTLQFPERIINRTCWRTLGNPLTGCVYGHGAGSGGDPNYCDKGFDTPNGCQAHSMDPYYGGIIANSQGVKIRDNASSGRPKITATSIVSDTMYGKPLQHVICNFTDGTEMPVNCVVADGRDESDFYQALGIVGSGPISEWGALQNQLLDGQPNIHPYQPQMIAGFEPDSAPFSLIAGGQYQYPYHAAGVARLVIQRTDPKGIQPTSPDSHSMTASIRKGIAGYVWSAPGQRGYQVLSNPVWVAVNAIIRSKGLWYADPATQEQHFDVASCIASAAICDLRVSTLVYNRNPVQLPVDGQNVGKNAWTPFTPTQPQMPVETQFQFAGIISQPNSLSTWLDSILQNCCGFWFSLFGKVYIGIRENAGAAEAFTIGNAIYNSYSDEPIVPNYNRLTASFADRDALFAQNTAQYYDEDHAMSIGGLGIPRYEDGQINLSGTFTASQAMRVTATRTREELGGVNEYEWQNAVEATWKTTILALRCYPGMTVSYTAEFAPNGYAKYRIQGITLNADYSITITARTVTDSMYDLEYGPKPIDVRPPWLPSLPAIQTINIPTWLPSRIYYLDNPLIGKPGYSTFSLAATYQTDQGTGTQTLQAIAGGLAPVTRYFTSARPTVGSIAPSKVAGTFKAGSTYYVQICGSDADGNLSVPSNKISVTLPAGYTAFELDNVVYPTGSVGYQVYVSDDPDTLGHMSTAGHASTLDSKIVVSIFIDVDWSVPPDQWTDVRIRFKAKNIIRPGVAVGVLKDVAPNQVSLEHSADQPGPIQYENQFVGLPATLIGVPSSGSYWVPVSAYITGTNAGYQVIGFDGFVSTAEGPIYSGQIIAIRAKADFWSANGIGCSQWVGIQPDEDVGLYVRIIGGTGVGQVRQVVTNTPTIHVVNENWTVMPDATSIYIIESSTYFSSWDTPVINNSLPDSVMLADFQIPGIAAKAILLIGVLVSNGYESIEDDAPFREIALNPAPLQIGTTNTGSGTGPVDYSGETGTISVQSNSGSPGSYAPTLYTITWNTTGGSSSITLRCGSPNGTVIGGGVSGSVTLPQQALQNYGGLSLFLVDDLTGKTLATNMA